jgi:hypothetical protein
VNLKRRRQAGVFASCCIFSDRSGVFRTFEVNDNAESGEAMPSNPRQRGRVQMQFTDEQLQRLQAQKPAITEAVMDGVEFAVDQGRGLQWLCLLGASGRLEVRSSHEHHPTMVSSLRPLSCRSGRCPLSMSFSVLSVSQTAFHHLSTRVTI